MPRAIYFDYNAKVVGQSYARHRRQDFGNFLQRWDAEFPGAVKLHVVMDNLEITIPFPVNGMGTLGKTPTWGGG